MEFGVQFFPDVGPDQKSGAQYFAESLTLAEAADRLGYEHVRTVEHYFHPYGGYSPDPIVFLSAVAARTKNVRLITGALLPAFNNPLKLAGQIGMLDAISGGRLEVGFARAFIPHEFSRFGVSLDESRDRFEEGIEVVRRLLEEENVAFEGKFHRFPPTTSLPRPTQQPRPDFWVAALNTPESFVNSGRAGYNIMAIPLAAKAMAERVAAYRNAWRENGSGRSGIGRVMLAFHMFCAETDREATRIARDPINRYLRSLCDAAGAWTKGASSKDYPGYDKIIAQLESETFENQVEQGAAWVGSPDTIAAQVAAYQEKVGGFETASLQINFNDLALDPAMRSLRLFADEVMPRFRRSDASKRSDEKAVAKR